MTVLLEGFANRYDDFGLDPGLQDPKHENKQNDVAVTGNRNGGGNGGIAWVRGDPNEFEPG
jgi:hypothetical protein